MDQVGGLTVVFNKPACFGVLSMDFTAFFISILNILLGCSKKQMIRSNATRIVASMTNQSFVDKAVKKFVDQAMGFSRCPSSIVHYLELPITVLIQLRSPYPAIASSINFIPEPFRKFHIGNIAPFSKGVK